MSSVFHRSRNSRKAPDYSAIFVHAGAGYHSIQNENIHLGACNDAALAAMACLRNGGSAVDAVEIAIKVLEDREITNAGYGSNLAIDGIVEGDAVVVDHFGRSGGCGAVSQVKNPISLARLVLELSTQELSLRRVPPNLLVGQGATDFAFDQGLPILPNDALVSPAARERWLRWKQDLKNAERKAKQQSDSGTLGATLSPQLSDPPPDYEEHVRREVRREHVRAMRAGVWNEGQPISPAPPAPLESRPHSGMSFNSISSSIDSRNTIATPDTPQSDAGTVGHSLPAPLTVENLERNSNSLLRPVPAKRTGFTDAQDAAIDGKDTCSTERDSSGQSAIDDSVPMEVEMRESSAYFTSHDGKSMSDEEESNPETLTLPSLTPTPPQTIASDGPDLLPGDFPEDGTEVQSENRDISNLSSLPPSSTDSNRADSIIDTVGAIAIDSEGNIACGASSGGIGMKFRGRIGPAALVGVGAAVVPADPEDKNRVCTAAVTSGTGEHMATTMAASTCADRVYHGYKRRRGGGFDNCEDDQAVRAMIEMDFMEHPSVKQSHSAGAIGVLTVKKTSQGVYLHFAHNTDSFAVASMHADEPKPTCTMSRSHGNGMVAQGGRAIRYKRKW